MVDRNLATKIGVNLLYGFQQIGFLLETDDKRTDGRTDARIVTVALQSSRTKQANNDVSGILSLFYSYMSACHAWMSYIT